MHTAPSLDSNKYSFKETCMGNLDSIFTMYAEPVLAELDRLDMSDFHLLMGCGTIDMVNPSLTVLGLVASGNRYEADILVLKLSPFVQRTMVAGKAVLGDLPSFEVDLQPLFALIGAVRCPSLLLSPTMLPPMMVEKLYQLYFRSRNDGHQLLEWVRVYPRDPFKRMQRERREQQNASKTLKDRRLESTEATELASQLLKPKTVDMEWKAFILAWAEVVSDAQDADSEAIVMSLEDFLSLYDMLQETCRFKWKRNTRKSRANGSRHPVS